MAGPNVWMPPEWHPQDWIWIGFPHDPVEWPGFLGRAQEQIAAFANAVAESGQEVRLIVRDETNRARASALCSAAVKLDTRRFGDVWLRDTGPLVVHRGDAPLGQRFGFNGWGGKYLMDGDQEIGAELATSAGLPVATADWILEGGALDCDGTGLVATTEQCLLNPNRNPQLNRADIERILCDAFGVTEVLWLGEGIEGDDTDGHIDDLTRFVDATTVVTVVEPNRADPNHGPLAANRRLLDTLRVGGRTLTVRELPMPEPQYLEEQRLPASYANFYIANGAVLVPTFACPQDDVACGVLRECFPDRRVVPVDCRVIIAGLGALHCLTQQVPAVPRAAA